MSTNGALKKCGLILEPVIKTVPGFIRAQFVYAKVKFISGKCIHSLVLAFKLKSV